METASLNEVELSGYCRERGLYPEQIKQWKADCMAAMQGSKASAAELKRQRSAAQTKKDPCTEERAPSQGQGAG
jgi:transposase